MCRADNLTTFMRRFSWNLGASTFWNPQGLSRSVMGLFYLYTPFWVPQPTITDIKHSFHFFCLQTPVQWYTCICSHICAMLTITTQWRKSPAAFQLLFPECCEIKKQYFSCCFFFLNSDSQLFYLANSVFCLSRHSNICWQMEPQCTVCFLVVGSHSSTNGVRPLG